jgi:hypothetical protein
MSLYLNINTDSPYTGVEFRPRPDGNFTVFYINDKHLKDKTTIAARIGSSEFGQEILAETRANGEQILLTRGPLSQEQIRQKLERTEGTFKESVPKHHFQPWKWRGNLSFIGQGLTLTSAARKGALDGPKLSFAALNIVANCVNLMFGGQKIEDEHRLYQLKTEFNDRLKPYLPAGETFPSPEDTRAPLRHDKAGPPTLSEKFHDFMKKNSVRAGEIGLRYLGSITLAFPMQKWKEAGAILVKGKFGEAFKTARNTNNTNFYTGALYLTGKTIGMFSKVPDPYNPKPHTMLDALREKFLFRLSTTIETGAAATLAYGGLKADPKSGKRDLIGGLGGAVLAGGLTSRFFADFGTRVLDREELRAHLTDCLARIPTDKLSQAVADTAAGLHERYGKKSPGFGVIYNNLTTALYRYHAIAVSPEIVTKPVLEVVTEKQAAVNASGAPSFTKNIQSNINHTERALTAASFFADSNVLPTR